MKITEEKLADVIVLNDKNIHFVYEKRFENDEHINEIYAYFVVKYKKEKIFNTDLNSYEYSVWERFESKGKKLNTIYSALSKGMTVNLSMKEYHFLFEEKPKLEF